MKLPKRERYDEDADIDHAHLPQVQKETDDIDAPDSTSRAGTTRRESTTLTTLSRLFAVQSSVSPEASRSTSYIQSSRNPTTYTRNSQFGETAALPDHLYARGLLEGRHSDITVHAFGQAYNLHRLILDRAPFFRSALSEPWLESNAKETTVHPEDIDASITQASFELALKRLYGCNDSNEESRDAVGLFATACWLEMQDLIESSIESMLRQMTPSTLAPLIKLVTSNYYGRAGDKILASAKAMLCRDGWGMRLRYWDGIPGDIVREIVGGDGFFIDGEWDRFVLAKQILDRRLKARAMEAGLVEAGARKKVLKAPDTGNLMAVRFDTVYRRNGLSAARMSDALSRWVSLYTHPDIEPLLVLLDEGIHYVHLDFEQLQYIKDAKDVLGLPVLPQKVIGDALWQQMELRQKVVNATEAEMELGISVGCAEESVFGAGTREGLMGLATPTPEPESAASKGKHRATNSDEMQAYKSTQDAYEEIESGSWDGNGRPRKFWIPTSDCNIVMGGTADPVIATSNNTTLQRHASRLSASTLQPEDIQWASDFSAVTAQPRLPDNIGGDSSTTVGGGTAEVRYTHYPPFRFAASFPNPRLLKEKKRVYSRTVFYAGSLWNIYIQKVASSRSKQLGVYLHRAKERDAEDVIAGTAGLAQGSVDERIGVLEREMLLRSERREQRRRRTTATGSEGEGEVGESEGSAGDVEGATRNSLEGVVGRSSAVRNLLDHRHSRSARLNARAQQEATSTNTSTTDTGGEGIMTPNSDFSDDSDSDRPKPIIPQAPAENAAPAQKQKVLPHVPTLPPYVDARPTIKTYFKIYSPSRGGRMLSVYESAPDRFNFSQSWGWKSSTLMLDEGMGSVDVPEDSGGASGGDGGGPSSGGAGGAPGGADDGGRLRFVVCIGNI